MGDGEILLLVLALLYVSDCVIWLRNRSVAFVSPWGGRWHVSHADSFFGNDYGSLLFLNPLPPLGRVFLSHLSPVSISPAGVCAFNPQALFRLGAGRQSGLTIRFDEIAAAGIDGANLLINNRKFTKCATSQQASRISKLINQVIDANVVERELLISRSIAQQFAADEANALLRKTQGVVRPIHFVCQTFFVFLFVATPALLITFGLLRLIIPVAIVLVLFAIAIAIMFFRAHRSLYGDDSQGRIENLIKMVLCPPVSIRATDLLTRNVLSEFSPVVLAGLLLGSRASGFVQAYVRDLQHPLTYETRDKISAEIISWAMASHLKVCIDYLSRGDLTPTVLFAPPQPEGDSVSYCPRCRFQFVVSSGPCPDCPGVNLLVFPSSTETKVGGAAWPLRQVSPQ
ncbi:MAG: hypothetical protein WAQ99_10260 [Pyrinomonadaceae bacterium]